MSEPTATLWPGYAGGMNAAADNPRAMREDELQLLVNGTVRGGFAAPRPAFVERQIAWLADDLQLPFERGVFQGAGAYASRHGPRLLLAFDGWLMTWDPETGAMRRLLRERPFSRHGRQVWFAQRGRYAVAQDGISPPVIIDGDTATQGTDNRRGVPTGCLMAEGHGRLFVVSADRRRIYASNHSADPLSEPLDFTEDTAYYLNARCFEVPEHDGQITALTFSPALNGDADLGPLLVFCQHATRAYDVSLPRETWLTQDISTVPLPAIGACSHAAVAVRGNDVLFSDHEGRIQTVRMAVARNDDARVNRIDRAVWPLYATEDAGMRWARWSVRHDDRALTTIRPERVRRDGHRWSIRHRGIVALNESAALPLPFVWDGLWTGIYPVCLIELAGRAYAISLDADGIHRLYELNAEARGHDRAPGPKAVPMLAALRPTDGGLPFLAKPVDAVAFRLGSLAGAVTLRGWWQADRESPEAWFEAHESAAVSLAFAAEGIIEPRPSARPRINPAKPPRDTFHEVAPWLEITGAATLEEVALTTTAPKPSPGKANTVCSAPDSVPARNNCGPNPWAYHARNAPAAACPRSVPCAIAAWTPIIEPARTIRRPLPQPQAEQTWTVPHAGKTIRLRLSSNLTHLLVAIEGQPVRRVRLLSLDEVPNEPGYLIIEHNDVPVGKARLTDLA